MKNMLLIFFLGLTTVASAQNILRVNNIPGINAPYTTIQAAVAAASAGDIILVEGSPTAYNVGAFDLTKKVILRGPGFFLNENITVQASQNPATINSTSFFFSPGSDGSTVSGLSFINMKIDVKTSNITISNNYFGTGTLNIALTNASPATNLLISGNYMIINSSYNIQATGSTYTNVIVSNNYFFNQISGWPGGLNNIAWQGHVFGTIKNNIFIAQNASNDFSNCDVVNNIFLNNNANVIGNTTNSTIRNNIFLGPSQTNADATNIFNAVQANLFIGLTGNTTDTQWKLKPGSAAIGAGALGEDCGIYGGITPYKISGVAAGLPAITAVNVPASVPQNGVLNVKVSAKVN